ncbi:MAG TPA: S8 family serine peptidase [Arsenophonus sp.]
MTGYGDLCCDGGPNNNYTHSFASTSSAAPIITSAAVAIQSWYKQLTGSVLTLHQMRELLIRTGTTQQHNDVNRYKYIGLT